MSGLAEIISKKFKKQKEESGSISSKDRAVAAMKKKRKEDASKSLAEKINFGGKYKS